jgi:subtilisin family serine protease
LHAVILEGLQTESAREMTKIATRPMLLSAALCMASTAALPASPPGDRSAPIASAPRADARVLRALASDGDSFRILLGVRDGTPSTPARLLHPDPSAEPARRRVRLEAQMRLADEMPAEELRVRRFYGSFSILSATVTRAALLTLANRPDVDWITLDGKKRLLDAESSNAQSLIHSDQANALGASGAGQAIAILDTGVDYTVTAMGGGGFPNAKVIGGTDTADNDDDPMDCDGHGTSVASVAASSSGVAPAAKIVAVKVFASKDTSNATCEDTADDSDILAGVDWAVAHREQFGIVALNLSLGGGFEDALDHGYCDADVPSYAAAFGAAHEAGIAVAVASGNDGTSNTLSAPACVSTAISVGAVYSQNAASQSWLDGSGGVQCTDAPAVPDQIVCFSNSSTNLSILAPGAFWVVAGKGVGATTFAGTSAASPAAAGAVALLRQIHPGMSPAAIEGLLRDTGTPITDPRNSVVTPRLDALAAVSLDPSFFVSLPPSEAPISIPDGSGSATASIDVLGLPGGVSSLEAVVEIDHPDPQQLKLTLHGPDGTSVVLRDQTGQHEHPINAVYGKTDLPLEPLDAFTGHPRSGTWSLVVEDRSADTPPHSGRIVNFALVLPGEAASTRDFGGKPDHSHHTRVVRSRRAAAGATAASAQQP